MMTPMSWGPQTGAETQGRPWAPSGTLKSSAQGRDRGKGRAVSRMATGPGVRAQPMKTTVMMEEVVGPSPPHEDEATSSRSLGSAQLLVHLALSHRKLRMGVDSGDKSGVSG